MGVLTVLVIVFGLSTLVLTGLILIITYSYNHLYEEIHASNRNKKANEFHTTSQIKQITKLATEFNELILRIQNEKKASEDKETELKLAIENMSHDLRTPLTSIKGYFSLLKKDNITDEERTQYANIITKKISALEQLISGFYELSRLQNNDYKMHEEKLNLGSVLAEEMVSFYTEFERVGIEPILHIEENLPMIYADPFVVQRIFNNLISNAIKYSDGDFKISLHLNSEGTAIISTFANSAKDLDEESATHLKERFFTADRTRTGQSTGIGLALVDTFLNNMGNSIDCNKVGDSLVFTITWNLPTEE